MKSLRTSRPLPQWKPRNAGSFKGRTPRFGRGNLSSNLSPAASSRPKRKAIARVGKHWATKPAVIVFPDGRERCNPGTAEGRFEYEMRRVCMFVRQWNAELDLVLCCVCRMPITLKEATWEHEFGRHASRIDERTWNPATMRHQNGVSHLWCNSQRGSKRTEIFHGNNCVIETERPL